MQPHKPRKAHRPLAGNQSPELIYGVHPGLAALANPRRRIIRVCISPNMATRLAAEASSWPIEPQVLHPRELDRIAGPDAVHQGLIVEAEPLTAPRLDKIERSGTLVLLDQVTDPHNVGAILRSCAAFNVTALVMTARHSPEGSAVLTKAASGAAEYVPLVKVTNLARAMEELRGYGFFIAGLDSEAPATIEDTPIQRPTALVLGAEGKGLRQLTRQTCDVLVRLDVPGKIASLNVSNAAALSLYALQHKT